MNDPDIKGLEQRSPMPKSQSKKASVSTTAGPKPSSRRLAPKKPPKGRALPPGGKKGKPKATKTRPSGQRSKAKGSAKRRTKSTAAPIAVLAHGLPLEASFVEDVISRQFGPKQFASLCNAIVWASSGRECRSLPSFTERVNAKDGGIDAEWNADLPNDGAFAAPLMGPGWNVFQYKQRDIFAQGREKTFTDLRSGLASAMKKLYQETGRRPDRYVLVTNVDLTHYAKGQKAGLKTSILKGYDQPTRVRIEIVGAAELASMLNSLPHLRSAFFAPDRFSTWQDYWDMHIRQTAYKFPMELVGRDNELTTIRGLINDSRIRAVILGGPQTIGKTRLTLHATEHRPVDTVVARDPRSMTSSDLLKLTVPGRETLVIVEDPDAERANEFVDQALASTDLKLVITLPTSENAPAPSYGRDDRVQTVKVKPLDDLAARQLLAATGVQLDFSIESWIIGQSGGNPGILLLAASLGPDLRNTASSFVDDVAQTFDAKLRQEFGEPAMRILRLLSLQLQVGIKRNAMRELEAICRIMGEGVTVNQVLNSLDRLERAGVVRAAGSYVEVIPPILANYLASAALRGRLVELLALFAALGPSGRSRLLQRLRGLKSEETRTFWDEMFGPQGLLANLPVALSNPSLLQLTSSVVPERVARLIEDGLRAMSVEERKEINGATRLQFTESIQELLFRRPTSASALRSLMLLAEAETERVSNNATGLFCSCFLALHHQLPLPLADRLGILNEVCDPRNSTHLRLLGIRAIEHGLSRVGLGMPLHQSHGAEPFDAPPVFTWGELWDYNEALVNLLMNLAQSDDPELMTAASRILPNALLTSAIPLRSDFAVSRFETIAERLLGGNQQVSVSGLIDAIDDTTKIFRDSLEKLDPELRNTVKQNIDRLHEVAIRLENSDYTTQLRRWVSGWPRLGLEDELDASGNRISRSVKMIRSLAQKAIDTPEVLTESELGWLMSGEAQRTGEFFVWLGKIDKQHIWLSKIEELGATSTGIGIGSAYWDGLASVDLQFVSQRLDELYQAENIRAEVVIWVTRTLPGSVRSVDRVIQLIDTQQVNPLFVHQALEFGTWQDSLRPADYLRYLKAVGGPDLGNAILVIDSLNMWLQRGKQIEGELADYAWQCLSAARDVSINASHSFDQVAKRLSLTNPERGFQLLEDLLSQPFVNRCWQPIDDYGQNNFWRTLLEKDRRRALLLILSLAQEGRLQGGFGSWNLRGMFDQVADQGLLIEFAGENEQNATRVSDLITNAQPGFWNVAVPILDRYPSSEEIREILYLAIVPVNRAFSGSYSTYVETAHKDVQRVLNEGRGSATTRAWLGATAAALRTQAEEQLLTETDRDTNDWQPYLRSVDGVERIWAIGALLRRGQTSKALEVVSRSELLAMLPNLGLGEDLVTTIREQLRN
jgi:hypothetical protein